MRSDGMFITARRILLYLIPLLALLGLGITIILDMYSLSLMGSYLAIPMLLGTLVFLRYRYRICEKARLDEKLFIFFPAAYFLLFALSELMLDISGLRQIDYYVTVTLMSAIILLEILLFESSRGRALLILAQIMALNLNLIWGVTMKYHLFIGRTDPIAHIFYLSTLIDAAHVTDAFDNYRAFPLWHILVCILYIIMKSPLPMEKMIFFANGLVYAILIPMTYMVSSKVFKDTSLALLISLIIIFFTDVIVYGMSSIPRSVVSFLELMLLFFILSNGKSRNNTKYLLISVALVPVLIMYHPVSMLFILVLFLLLIVMDLIFRNDEHGIFSKKYFILCLIICLVYYIYYSAYIFQYLLEHVAGFMPTVLTVKGVSSAPLEEVINYLQHVPILFFIVIGILWLLGDERFSKTAKILCLLGILTSVVSFPGPVMLLSSLAENFNIMRFGEYAFIFIIMIAAVGFVELFYRTRRNGRIILVIVFMVMVLLSVSNDFTASDNPLVKRIFYTFYMTEEEVTSLNYLCGISDGLVMSDQVATRYIECSPYEKRSQVLEVDIGNMSILINSSKPNLPDQSSALICLSHF